MDTLATEYLLRTFRDQSTDASHNSSTLPIVIPYIDRDRLSYIFHELGFTSGAEIGVEEGLRMFAQR